MSAPTDPYDHRGHQHSKQRYLIDADWAGEWAYRQALRNRPDDASMWDSRAHDYGISHPQSNYVREFLSRLSLAPGDTVLDMGCGPGSCALALAQQDISVVAVDFSRGMLDELMKRAKRLDVDHRITCIHASWEDDWDACNIPQVDVAFASRSIMVAHLQPALLKLTSRARRLVSASLIACPSPRFDQDIYCALGLKPRPSVDYIYAVNILYQLGYYAEVSMIFSQRSDVWRSYDEAYQAALRGLPILDDVQDAQLHQFLQEHLIPAYDDRGEQVGLQKNYAHVTQWAQLTWRP